MTKYITFWSRYVDDKICFVITSTTEFIISLLKRFNKNIQFEEENNETIPFLDILISQRKKDIPTTVYQTSTCNDVYLNWNASAPATWKRGDIETLVE